MVGIFIVARLGSTRLERKHLIKVNDQTFIEWLVQRLINEFAFEIEAGELKIFITTSVKPENKEFESIFHGKGVNVFYGNDSNIPLRQIECAKENNISIILSIDGDDILCSMAACREVIKKLQQGGDIFKTQGLPFGMNVSGYKTNFLKEALKIHQYNKLETGWGKIFDDHQIGIIEMGEIKNTSNIRMTLDYQKDADFFKAVISDLGNSIVSIRDSSLIETIVKNGWHKLNESLNDEYWENFNSNKQSET
jgi:spore coat polysaccharide biosynthesis protein SpsF